MMQTPLAWQPITDPVPLDLPQAVPVPNSVNAPDDPPADPAAESPGTSTLGSDANGAAPEAMSQSGTDPEPNPELAAGTTLGTALDRIPGTGTEFRSQFTDCMEMFADAATVANYLDNHPEWFRRCAHPMQADPIGQTGYALGLGKFGALGYDVEPKIGLDLLPQEARVYRIRTIPVPDYKPVGYDVDFQAALALQEPSSEVLHKILGQMTTEARTKVSSITRVEWVLNLGVYIHFPRFIQMLPKPLIQTTGDRLVAQIVRQVSRRLTRKVQKDFHDTHGLPLPTHRSTFTRKI